MAINTSKNIPARSTMPVKPKAMRATPSVAPDPSDLNVPTKKAQTVTVTIAGEGTIPLVADGAMRRVARGQPVEVTKAEKAVLVRNKIPHSKDK